MGDGFEAQDALALGVGLPGEAPEVELSTVSGTSRSYAYNGDGLLHSRTQGGTTNFLWDPATSPSRLLSQGGERVVYGLGPLYIIKDDGTTRALARDGSKSVRVEVHGSGSVTASFRYRAYGEISQWSGASTPAVLGYAGQLLDPSGLYYMRARWYDPGAGRFVTRDLFQGDVNVPASLNSYAYGHASPAVLVDASGYCVGPVVAACVAVAAAAASIGPAAVALFTRLGAAAASFASRAQTAAQRAQQIHNAAQGAYTRNQITVAVGETVDKGGQVLRIVATSEARLRPAQRAALYLDEVEAVGRRGVHAEVKVIQEAQSRGLDLTGVAASRTICPACLEAIEQIGASPLTP